jgi:hypothetical protein
VTGVRMIVRLPVKRLNSQSLVVDVFFWSDEKGMWCLSGRRVVPDTTHRNYYKQKVYDNG